MSTPTPDTVPALLWAALVTIVPSLLAAIGFLWHALRAEQNARVADMSKLVDSLRAEKTQALALIEQQGSVFEEILARLAKRGRSA
jgi:hypothetical protein